MKSFHLTKQELRFSTLMPKRQEYSVGEGKLCETVKGYQFRRDCQRFYVSSIMYKFSLSIIVWLSHHFRQLFLGKK